MSSTYHIWIGSEQPLYIREDGRWQPIDWDEVRRREAEWQQIIDAFYAEDPDPA